MAITAEPDSLLTARRANGAQPTAFVQFEANEVVATAGSGVAIAAGHDIQAKGNRVVSCGITSAGIWYAWKGYAVYIWNFYSSSQFYNNTVTGTVGGLVGQNANGAPMAYDAWVDDNPETLGLNVSGSNNDFTDPCLVAGSVNLQAEDKERAYWATKIADNGELIGDQHVN